ncbi:competence protein CoiA [Alkalibacterium subtropicum]|uniref:Competence protein CoiA n=1 Tax=Alkalibacterium subtropicum TaxID=753702 RepID=A0A1I1EA59_9LACT|nr:competence protein CoiA family protein [Alkalibacterium subtropicum]SFB84004.1 competence protein CoiA [Alkalibacterium subtropicum]
MFTALNKQHHLVTASEYTGERPCYCPGCREEVIFRKGKINQAHFAHKNQSLCQTFSEGETVAHIEGKLLLYHWFKKEEIEVELEAYLPEVNQRPDLLIQYNGFSVAIEYQCSPISKETIRSRTEGYNRNNIKVIWILGEKLKVNKALTTRHYEYLSLNTHGSYHLFQLDGKEEQLEVITDIKGYGTRQSFMINRIDYEDDISCVVNIVERRWHNNFPVLKSRIHEEKNLYRLSFYKDQRAKRFFELLYYNNMHIKTLPDVIFYSVSKEWFIRTFSYQWKLILVLWLEDLHPTQVITTAALNRKVKGWEKEGEIIFHYLPAIEEDIKILPFFQFLNLLCDKGYLYEVAEHKWVRSGTIL